MKTSEKSGSGAIRHIGRWCMWVAAVSLGVALTSGFGGTAHKEACLPQPGHCNGDLLQNALMVLYFGALITLAARILIGVIVGVTVAVRAASRDQGDAARAY
ncbi:MAG: hypothetical protein NVS2B16_31030 [Chloroflexota bacterium]